MTEDQRIIAVIVVIIVLLVWGVLGIPWGKKENLHSYWHRTNCFPGDAVQNLKGPWKAVGSKATYVFSSPKVALNESEQTIVGDVEATGAQIIDAVIRYARDRDLYQPGESYIKTDSVLKNAFSTSSSMLSMRDVGALGSRIMLTVNSPSGSSKDIEYEFEFCFFNSRTGQSYIRLRRLSNDRDYDVLVSADELKLRGGDGGTVLIATR